MRPHTAEEAMANARRMGLSPQSVESVGRNFDRGLPILTRTTEGGPSEALPLAVRACDVSAHEPVSWLVLGRVPGGELTLVVGDAGSGKTSFTLKMAIEHAAGGGVVLVVSGEDPSQVLSNRLSAIAIGEGLEARAILQSVHILAQSGLQLIDSRWQSHLLAEVNRLGATLVLLDPLYELAGSQEDSNDAQRPLIRFLRQLMAWTGTTVIVCHHFGKAAEGRRKIDRVRGASAWFGAARAVYAIEARDEGIQVECLKMSRAAKPATYLLARTIISDEANPGTWCSAVFSERSLDGDAYGAEVWLVKQLGSGGAALTTSQLRQLARGSGCSREDLTTALRHLYADRRITFTPGRRGAKHWRLSTLPNDCGNVDEPTLPNLPDAAAAGSTGSVPPCPAPIGAGRVAERHTIPSVQVHSKLEVGNKAACT